MDHDEFTRRYVAARRKTIARDFPELNDAQLRAAMRTSGAVRIVAGAGSGKTATLIARTANILKYGTGSDSPEVPASADMQDLDVLERYAETGDPLLRARAEGLSVLDKPDPRSVLAVTFTNKAARELRDRLSAKIGPDGAAVQAMTFHSLGLRLLRRYGAMAGISPEFAVCDEDMRARGITSIMTAIKEEGRIPDPKLPLREVSARLSALKFNMRDTDIRAPRNWGKPPLRGLDPTDPATEFIAAVYNKYENDLEESELLDFDDLVVRFYDMLAEPHVRAACQSLWSYVMVDEYQDTDPVQDAIIRILTDVTGNLCVVGDDDQSIYSFRGAEVGIFRTFDANHPDAMTVKLEKNYRSTANIVDASAQMIAANPDRIGKTMEATRDEGSLITYRVLADTDAEGRYIASEIKKNHAASVPWSGQVVLVRGWRYLNKLQRPFIDAAIPYDIPNGATFFKSIEIRDVSACLRIALNPNDKMHMERVVDKLLKGVGKDTWNKVTALAALKGISPIDVMADPALMEAAGAKSKAKSCSDFADDVIEMNKAAHGLPLADAVRAVVDAIGYVPYLEEKAEAQATDEDAEIWYARIENVKSFIGMAETYQTEHAGQEDCTLRDFLDAMTLDDGTEADQDRVLLMTAHRSKGLEFPCVYVAGLADGTFPLDFDGVNPLEERRLFYVSMTRAMDKLYLTRPARMPDIRGRWVDTTPSRFLYDVPARLADTGQG